MSQNNVRHSAGRVALLLLLLPGCFEEPIIEGDSTSGGTLVGTSTSSGTGMGTTSSSGLMTDAGGSGSGGGGTSSTTGPASTSSTTGTTSGSTGGLCASPMQICDGECVDVMVDDLNCGECGNTCNTFDGIGGCAGGICLPAPGECFQNNQLDCFSVCLFQGLTCAENACDGNGVWKYFSQQDCENNTFNQGGGVYSTPCSSVNHGEPWVRCCCQG